MFVEATAVVAVAAELVLTGVVAVAVITLSIDEIVAVVRDQFDRQTDLGQIARQYGSYVEKNLNILFDNVLRLLNSDSRQSTNLNSCVFARFTPLIDVKIRFWTIAPE